MAENQPVNNISSPGGKVAAVIVAAGRSARMAGLDKQFALAGGRPLLAHTVAVFEQCPLVDEYVIVLSQANLLRGRALALEEGWSKLRGLVVGGLRRQDSVWNGLQALDLPEWVLIHDGARCFVTEKILSGCLAAAHLTGACIAAVPVKDTIKLVEGPQYLVQSTPPRDKLWAVQTPQVFRYDILREAHLLAQAAGVEVTDDATLVEMAGGQVKVFLSEYTNLKVTTPDDLHLAQTLFSRAASSAQVVVSARENIGPVYRIGQGFDVHPLASNRLLILGGVTVPYERGLEGHSDADVLTHAIINGLLGAAGLGDIGRYFPPTDPAYKGISSLEMLRQIYSLVRERGWQVCNIDATIVAQQPKLAAYIPAMRQSLATTLGLAASLINIKATTTEKLGFVGRLEGLEGQAIVLLSG